MEKKQNVPALRFQGFSGEWEKKTLGDFGNVAMNRRIFKEQTSETGEIPFYKIGTFGKEPDAYISRQLFEEYKAKYPYPDVGDILLSAAGSIGKTVEYTGKDEYFQDSNIVWLKHDERLDNPFLKYFYSKVKWGTLEGGTVKRLYNKILLETEIVLPEIIEQKKIGKFFASYDRMIAHQEGKIRKLQQFRQAMLTKLFPREGAAEPALRFQGFFGPWRHTQISDIADVIGGGTPDTQIEEYWNGDIDWYTPAEMEGKRYANGSDRKITELGLAKSGARLLPAHRTVLFTSRAGIGKMAILGKDGATNQGFQSLVLNDYCDPYFIYTLGPFITKCAERIAAGSTFLEISGKALGALEIMIPTKAEQEKIAKFFEKLDDIISLQQEMLDKIQKLKAALLEKLFV